MRAERFELTLGEARCVPPRLCVEKARQEADALASWERAWASRSAAGVRTSAAVNVAATWIRLGRGADAVRLMEDALKLVPLHGGCWSNLLVGLIVDGRPEEARRQLAEAERRGIAVDPELRAAIVGGGS